MADQERKDVVLDLRVDQGSMINELERSKKSIIQLREEQQKLTKAYKDGAITVDEYAAESVRLEAIMKKEQKTYSDTQKAVTGVKTQMDKLIDSNKQLASEVKIGGTSISDLTTKITALANPVTAAVGVVTALGAAYARSTIGARDLEFASNQLSAATTLATNAFASLFSSAEDGEGFVSKLTDGILFKISPALAVMSRQAAMAQEIIQDLQRNEIISRGEANERLAENQELMTKVQDSQTDLNEKLHLTNQIITNLRTNEDELLKIKNEQLKQIEAQLSADSTNEKLLDAQALKLQEISAIKKDTERKVGGIQRLESNLLDVENKKAEANRKQREEVEKKIQAEKDADAKRRSQFDFQSFDPDNPNAEFDPQAQLEKDKGIIDAELDLVITAEQQKQAELLRTNAVKDMIAEEDRKRLDQNLEQTKANFLALADLFSQGSEARKIFALLGIGADTAQAIASLTAASEANPANAFTFGGAGIAQYAAGIIRILSNIVAAKQFLGGNFAGGGDFVTTKPTLIMVGDNPGHRERVTVEPLSGRGKSNFNRKAGLANFAGGGSMTFDGVSSSANISVTQSLATANAIKGMPRPVVGVREFAKVANRVEVKEAISRR